ncbi:MAG: outer membrane protein assembly factor BamB [Betaproteobacteria bacterium]
MLFCLPKPPLLRMAACLFIALGLVACAGTEKPKPTALEANPATLRVKEVWRVASGPSAAPLEMRVVGERVLVASSQGEITAIDAASGLPSWKSALTTALSAGIGTDGDYVAVVTRDNYLVVLREAKEIWRQKLASVTLTAPLVAGARVFLVSADRTVLAFDAGTGRKLWTQQRSGESLLLGQAGILMAMGDTLVTSQSGRLVGLNPQNGSVRWDVSVAVGRGVNEVERLVDLVAGTSRMGDELCVRAFQTSVACVDTASGKTRWTKSASGATGLGGNAVAIFGTESDGKVLAWRRSDGERLWGSEKLRFRGLSAPLAASGALVLGDAQGVVHFLSLQDGALLTRLATDGSPVVGSPLWVANTWVVVTQSGAVIGFRPE